LGIPWGGGHELLKDQVGLGKVAALVLKAGEGHEGTEVLGILAQNLLVDALGLHKVAVAEAELGNGQGGVEVGGLTLKEAE